MKPKIPWINLLEQVREEKKMIPRIHLQKRKDYSNNKKRASRKAIPADEESIDNSESDVTSKKNKIKKNR